MTRAFLAASLLAVAMPVACLRAADQPAPQPGATATPVAGEDDELKAQASYLVGRNAGQAIGRYGFDLDQLVAGLRDAAENKPSKIDESKAQDILNKFQQRQEQKQAHAGDQRKADNPKWLEVNGKKPGITTTASGLQYEVLAKGAGKSPVKGDQVSVNYTGKLVDGTVFDASDRHGGAATFGVGQVIEGWNEALQLMKEGDKWRLFIPSGLAYGEQAPPDIGPNQILVFEVELVKVMPKGQAVDLGQPQIGNQDAPPPPNGP